MANMHIIRLASQDDRNDFELLANKYVMYKRKNGKCLLDPVYSLSMVEN